MFTGIIERTGVVDKLRAGVQSQRLVITSEGWPPQPQRGDSIAINGCCLTLVEAHAAALHFDVIPQTLAQTTLGSWGRGQRVNLERSATPTTLLGGHLVQGHVDGVGTVLSVEQSGEWRVRVSAPPEVAPFLVSRGSITVDGVSLTVAAVNNAIFDVCLIPETLARTTLAALVVDDHVNLEVDAIAKLVDASVRRALGRAV